MKSVQRNLFAGIVIAVLALMVVCKNPVSPRETPAIKPPVVHAQVPRITVHPRSASYNPGHDAVPLTVTAVVDDNGTLSYQWYRNTSDSTEGGQIIDNAVQKQYVPTAASESVFYYYAKVTNTISNNGDGGNKTASINSNTARIVVSASALQQRNPAADLEWVNNETVRWVDPDDGASNYYIELYKVGDTEPVWTATVQRGNETSPPTRTRHCFSEGGAPSQVGAQYKFKVTALGRTDLELDSTAVESGEAAYHVLGTSKVWTIVEGGGSYIAGAADKKIAYSTDGTTWTLSNSGNVLTGSNVAVRGIAWAPDKGTGDKGRFAAVGYSGNAAWSDDGGATWTKADSKFTTSILCIAYGNGKFVAAGDGGEVRYSSDGITWNQIQGWSSSGTSKILDVSGSPRAILSLVYDGTRFVAFNERPGKHAYSIDGDKSWVWISDTINANETSRVLKGGTFGNGAYLVLSAGNTNDWTGSTDTLGNCAGGHAWPRWVSAGMTAESVAFSREEFIVTGNNGRASISVDKGISWMPITDTQFTTGQTISAAVNLSNGSVLLAGPGKFAAAAISRIPVTEVTLNKNNLTLTAGEAETLIPTVMPANALNKNVNWASSDSLIAAVDSSGRVEAVGAGMATVTVTAIYGGITAQCIVTVNPHNDIVSINSPYSGIDWQSYGQYKAGMHVHTTNSKDAKATLSSVIEDHYTKNYDILAITDHSYDYAVTESWTTAPNGLTAQRFNQIAAGMGRGGRGMLQIPWTSEQSRSPDHLNTFFANYSDKDKSNYSLEDSIKGARDNGGISHINHPGRWLYGDNKSWAEAVSEANKQDKIKKYVDLYKKYPSCVGIEIVNQKDKYAADRVFWDNILKSIIPQGRSVWGLCNDDSHANDITGHSFNMFVMPENSMANFRAAMESGHFYAVAKVSKHELGDNFTATGPVPVIKNIVVDNINMSITISAQNHNRIEWISDGTIVGEGNTIMLKEHKAGVYIRANIIGAGGIAFTQPFGIGHL